MQDESFPAETLSHAATSGRPRFHVMSPRGGVVRAMSASSLVSSRQVSSPSQAQLWFQSPIRTVSLAIGHMSRWFLQ